MSIFTKVAMNVLMNNSHPEIDRKQCWNLHPHREQCTDCKDICPYGEDVFSRPNLAKDWDLCTDCGLCVSVCRTRCITPSSEQVQRDLSQAGADNETVWIGCEQSARHNDIVRACVGALCWEALAYLALNKKLVLDLTPCGECENDRCAALLRSNLTRLVEFLGQPLFDARITLAYQPDEAPYLAKELSRREMFAHMGDTSKNGTRQLLRMLPGLQEDDDNTIQPFRYALNERLKQLKTATVTPFHYGVYLPAFTSKCFGCGRCEKNCKAGAIRFEDLPDGQTRIVVTPWRCSECGMCVSSCNHKAIDGMKLRQLTSLGPVSVLRFSKRVCTDCGKPIPTDSTDGLCATCRVKQRTKKRQEAAAARAKQRAAERAAQRAAKQAAEAAGAPLPAQPAAETPPAPPPGAPH